MAGRAEVIVIGAGLGGMSAGALLARSGRETIVFERASFIGGRSHVVVKDGFTLDYGIHMNRFHSRGKMAEVMRAAGDRPRFFSPGPPEVFKNGSFFPFPSAPAELIKTELLSPLSKLSLLKLLAWTALNNPDRAGDVSLADALSSIDAPDDLSELCALLASTALANPYPELASMKELKKFLEQLLKNPFEPVGYIKGGWNGFFDLMKKNIESNGKILTRRKVERVVFSKGRATGVESDGEKYECDALVCAVPFQDALKIIDAKHMSPPLVEYAKRVEPTCGVVVDFALSRPVSDKSGLILTPDPVTMGCLISNVDPSLAPAGKQLGTWLQFIPASRADDKEFVKKTQKELLDLIGRALPGVWDACEWKRELFTPVVDGAMLKVGQTWNERAPLVSPEVHNLFFAGDTTCGVGAGGDIALDSALRVSKLVRKYLRK